MLAKSNNARHFNVHPNDTFNILFISEDNILIKRFIRSISTVFRDLLVEPTKALGQVCSHTPEKVPLPSDDEV